MGKFEKCLNEQWHEPTIISEWKSNWSSGIMSEIQLRKRRMLIKDHMSEFQSRENGEYIFYNIE